MTNLSKLMGILPFQYLNYALWIFHLMHLVHFPIFNLWISGKTVSDFTLFTDNLNSQYWSCSRTPKLVAASLPAYASRMKKRTFLMCQASKQLNSLRVISHAATGLWNIIQDVLPQQTLARSSVRMPMNCDS